MMKLEDGLRKMSARISNSNLLRSMWNKPRTRDFMRAMVLHILDNFERNDKFIKFMKNNGFLDVDAYQTMVTNIEKFQKQERSTREIIIVVTLESKRV